MRIRVDPFVPGYAGERDLRGYSDVTMAVFLEADPSAPQHTFGAVVDVLRAPDLPSMHRRFWIARGDDGNICGLVIAYLPSAENTEAVIAEVRVLPTTRRQGIGVALLRAMLNDATVTLGRNRLVGVGVVGDSDGDRWASGFGFKRTQERVLQVLHVAEADPARWSIPFPPVGLGNVNLGGAVAGRRDPFHG